MALTPYEKSLHCHYCERCWPPLEDDYGICPVCREPTYSSHLAPMSGEIAREARLEADFGWWLWTEERV